ncbi:uncharacterized protein LOC106638604 [Copidosoma floridanum]|uniref:uncharacterized protein LOC106638604 n=1 Tax=Copidosoma floridanum TaxID=29053 RepID=UPI0006C98FBE|nr:uncharacterized protein LOC106638604 [Copidosoma floridanum]
MSWDSISSKDYIGHQLSATALLGSPDGSRHPIDVYEFSEEDYRRQFDHGYDNGGSFSLGVWECLKGCRHRIDQHLARRKPRLFQPEKLIRPPLEFGQTWKS